MKCKKLIILPSVLLLFIFSGLFITLISSNVSIIETAEARGGRAASVNRAGIGRRSVKRNHRYNYRRHNRNYNRVGTRVVGIPSYCQAIVSRGIEYYRCDGIYYRPYYHGTQLVFIIVEGPT